MSTRKEQCKYSSTKNIIACLVGTCIILAIRDVTVAFRTIENAHHDFDDAVGGSSFFTIDIDDSPHSSIGAFNNSNISNNHGKNETTGSSAPHDGDPATRTNELGTDLKEQRPTKDTKDIISRDILDELDVLSGGPDAKTLECPEPLVPFQNIIVRDPDHATITSTRKIPRILHFSYKSRCLPRDIARNINKWRETLPTYSIFFHDDEAVERMFQQDWTEFPRLHKAMRCVIYKGAMKIDVWRVLMLYKYGGLYSDIDNWPMKKFKERKIRSDLSFFSLKDSWNRPSQWFMAAEPGHPIMSLAMNTIVENILGLPDITYPDVVFVTGPHAFKAGYEQFVRNGDDSIEHKIVFRNDQVVTGMHNKTAFKSAKKLVEGKFGYKDIVPYNSTLNVTRDIRIDMDGGVGAWQQTMHKHFGHLSIMSCEEYLKSVDNGTISEFQRY